ncbi:hypothetical protein K439DRAFT_1622696 [Ramaria rubella]|nr:hypothetical protein K439DRAFT_1622696 [Ramaria rubella]
MPESVLPIQKDQVILGVVNRQYAAFSVVSDYTLRPEFYDDITVYDWMCQAHKEKGQVKLPPPDKDDETQVDLEDEGHGTASLNPTGPLTPGECKHKHVEDYSIYQEDTDDIIDEDEITLNDMKFLDGHPQWYNKGDHEYYCATMLTLFKLWRTGQE